MSKYTDLIKRLPTVTLDSIADLCKGLLPRQYKRCPWLLPYGDKNFAKIFTNEDELNGYAAAYTVWHKAKLRSVFDHTPADTFVGDIAIVDWGCGQGLATLFLHEYLIEKRKNCQIKEVILIEPSAMALERAQLNIACVDSQIIVSAINKEINDVLDIDVQLFEKRKVINLFSNILDIRGISLKRITERLAVNLSKDSFVLCVSPYYSHMERTFDTFLQYFHHPLVWQYRDSQSNKSVHSYTYIIQSLKLIADKAGQIVYYEYFPASQFRACYALDCVDKLVHKELVRHSYFDVYAPYEFTTTFSDDVEPLLAVLNNIVCRGLPTRTSLFVERVLCSMFGCAKESTLYGGITFKSLLNHSEEVSVKEYVTESKLGPDRRLNQLIYVPIAIARVQKLLIEALITKKLDIQMEEWNILIEECDVPFAMLAVEDFKDVLNHLSALTQDFNHLQVPKINLKVISCPQYKDSPLIAKNAVFRANEKIKHTVYDLVIRYSSTPIEQNCNFSEYQVRNDCFFCVYSSRKRYAQRYIYTTERVLYKPLCMRASQGVYLSIDENVKHLRYFLQLIFRKEDFRPGQLPILSRALQNQSVIGLLPTGGGKSLTYQLAAFLQPGISLVIDPLVSLMKDQYDGLLNAGIDCCTYINSQVADSKSQREYDMEHSKCLFVFMSPERLCIHSFRQRLLNMEELKVYFAYGIIDETHCVSEWGHDFRFSYLHLGRNLYQYVLPKQVKGDEHISLFGLTATASFDVLADVERELSGEGAFPIDDDAVVRYENTNRLELQYRVVEIDGAECKDKWDVYQAKNALAAKVLSDSVDCLKELQQPHNLQYIKDKFLERENIVRNEQNKEVVDEIMSRDIAIDVDNDWATSENSNAAAIVFCPHRQGSLGVNGSSTKRGIKQAIADGLCTERVSDYVGGDVLDEQDKFLNSETNIMVATKAFGMGIDKPNVRFTLNINHSGSLEGFIQEAGRAGRDRKMALSTIMYCPKEFSEQNERTRLMESVPVDYGVHQFFYNGSFIGPDFEKWVMFFLMSKNTDMSVQIGEEDVSSESVSGFIDSLLSSSYGETIVCYISYNTSSKNLQWINDRLTYNNLPRFKTKEDEEMERTCKAHGVKYPAYIYGYADYTAAIQKAIYRMCCVGVIDDFTQDYVHESFRIVAKRKRDGDYFLSLKQFLKRYYTDERAEVELAKAHETRGKNEIQKCLSFITEFVYTKIAMKRKRAIKDMESFCNRAIHSKKNWLEINEDLKDDIYLYFNSKYAREDFVTDQGEPFSLTKDTKYGAYSSFDVLFKYMRVVDDDVMNSTDSQIGNIKHLHGAVKLIRRSLTDTNPALDMLNAYCLLFLGVENNQSLQDEMKESFIEGYIEFRSRMLDDLKRFYANIKRLKKEIQKPGRNVVDDKEMSIIEEWEAEAELLIHASWVKNFKNNYLRTSKNKGN